MLKLFTIVGARPQFIKAATVSREIRQHFSTRIVEYIIHTGQHYDHQMSEVFFTELGIPEPFRNLGVGGKNRIDQLEEMRAQLMELFHSEKPDRILVYGDTTSTLAGAQAAAACSIPIAHVEAGLRSYDWSMPEEENRVLTDRLSDILFCPTEQAVINLEKEGITHGEKVKVELVGDVMYDSVKYYAEKYKESEVYPSDQRTALVTLHRAGNTDVEDRFRKLVGNMIKLAEEENLRMVWPVHPRIFSQLKRMFPELETHPLFELVAPLSYLETLALQRRSSIGITDSGGVQKEMYLQGRPCLILRAETEWTEIVKEGKAVCVDDSYIDLKSAFHDLAAKSFVPNVALFGDGHSAHRICKTLIGE